MTPPAPDTLQLSLACRDGRTVRLRPLQPSDREALAHGLTELSQQSRYLRFMGARDHLSRAELRYLTHVDGHDHVAWVAGDVDADGTEHGLGVGRFVRLVDDPRAAEPALTVIDAAQGRGIGTLLLGVLVRLAAHHDVDRFEATVLARNRAMLEIFDQLGGTAVPAQQGSMQVDLPIPTDPAAWPDSAAGAVCRRVAVAVDEALQPRR